MAASGELKKLVWVDRTGNEEVFIDEPGDYRSLKISPDGEKIAFANYEGGNMDIWVIDIAQKIPRKLTFDEAYDGHPLWSVDSKRIIFGSMRGGTYGLYSKAIDGIDTAELIFSLKDLNLFPASLSAKGDILTLAVAPANNPMGLYISALFMNEGREFKNILQGKPISTHPVISPDGRWLAYALVSENSMEPLLYVSPFPDVKNSGKRLISKNIGEEPLWSPDGLELFYRSGNKVMAVPVESNETFNIGQPVELFKGNYYSSGALFYNRWDIHPDGKRFLMIKRVVHTKSESNVDASIKINVVLNWFEELKKLVPAD